MPKKMLQVEIFVKKFHFDSLLSNALKLALKNSAESDIAPEIAASNFYAWLSKENYAANLPANFKSELDLVFFR